jgi:hypothetical protein
VTSSGALDEILGKVQITHVAEAHGVKLDRTRRRGVATWRKGKNLSVSFDDSKNVWHDFVSGEAGGVVSLVQRLRGCDKKEAVEWLANFAGVPLREPTDAERRQWRSARGEAESLVRWKAETLDALRWQRGRLQRIYHAAKTFVLNHTFEECEARGDLRYELALEIGETYWPRVEEMDAQIDRLEATSYADLLERFRGAA